MLLIYCFFALTGFFIIKLYRLLFPRFIVGGYIAFSLFLMHPAMILSRLMVLHFEFVYLFLVVLATYYFVMFCLLNFLSLEPQGKRKKMKYIHWLIISILLYGLAITFKEPAILLGPVLAVYLCLSLYAGQPLLVFARQLLQDKRVRNILLLLIFVSMLLAVYLSLQWPNMQNPVKHPLDWKVYLSSINEFLRVLVASPGNFFPEQFYSLQTGRWRDAIFPLATRLIVWFFVVVTIVSLARITKKSGEYVKFYQKSLIFYLFPRCFILPCRWSGQCHFHGIWAFH